MSICQIQTLKMKKMDIMRALLVVGTMMKLTMNIKYVTIVNLMLVNKLL